MQTPEKPDRAGRWMWLAYAVAALIQLLVCYALTQPAP
jgi:hypothetical protein